MLTDFYGNSIINQPFDLSDSQFPNLWNVRIGTRRSLRLLSALSAVITAASAQDKEQAVMTGKVHWGVMLRWSKCMGKSKMWQGNWPEINQKGCRWRGRQLADRPQSWERRNQVGRFAASAGHHPAPSQDLGVRGGQFFHGMQEGIWSPR